MGIRTILIREDPEPQSIIQNERPGPYTDCPARSPDCNSSYDVSFICRSSQNPPKNRHPDSPLALEITSRHGSNPKSSHGNSKTTQLLSPDLKAFIIPFHHFIMQEIVQGVQDYKDLLLGLRCNLLSMFDNISLSIELIIEIKDPLSTSSFQFQTKAVSKRSSNATSRHKKSIFMNGIDFTKYPST
ncbi:hypothetical protein NPIL_570061 [Nephila pilipes]|uniref:Uncharacterized protein n=1 Tax=Nephila pilipes TaxID=299642 RepID=A0A8X6U5A4_NEPPI|nr:hypothetical protein NPIL_570061 [Nephila pilipes]